MKPKILVIGLDAATMELIEPWTESGYLPTLAGLMHRGWSSPLISTPNMHSASAWTSILTGLNPGRHGLFVFSDRDFYTGRQLFFTGGDRTGDLLTSHLARNGFSSGLFNVPMTYPAEAMPGGYMVSGLDAPLLNAKAFAPPELMPELKGRFPEHSFTPPGLEDLMRSGRLGDATQAWIKLTERQTRVADYLLRSRPVDLFMTVFTASDWGGHNLWTDLKESFPASEAGPPRNSDLLRSLYVALDSSIASLLDHTNDETQVYVISDHGMGPHTGASYYLADWLERNKFMVRERRTRPRTSILSAGKRAARDLVPVGLREKVKRGLGPQRLERLRAAEKDSFHSSVDWSRTTAYAEPGRHVININLTGRNPAGIVSPEDYEQTCRSVSERLSEWTDSRGERVVDRVVRRDEVYTGEFVTRASDLFVYWNPRARLDDPPADVQARGFWWNGDHRREGVLICKGPGIKSGSSDLAPVVYDLVPTILYLAGFAVPDNLDGRVIEEACEDEFLSRLPLRIVNAETGAVRDGGKLDQAEEKMVEEKLRSLGYM